MIGIPGSSLVGDILIVVAVVVGVMILIGILCAIMDGLSSRRNPTRSESVSPIWPSSDSYGTPISPPIKTGESNRELSRVSAQEGRIQR